MIDRLPIPVCLVVGVLISIPALAQDYTQVVRGKVIDKDSRSPLIGAEVVVLGTDPLKGAVTDTDGEFRIEKVPVGRHDLQVSYLGYEKKVLPNVVVTSGKEVVMTIALQEKIYEAEEITVTAEEDKKEPLNKLAPVSARQFTVEETNRFAGTRADPSRMVSNYAGVTSANDARNDIIVRGNSPLGVLWRLEDIDIPNPNHFSTQGATGGPISMLNNNLLDNSDFLTGAFPAEYGNATAAVFDVQMREGNDEQMEFTGQAGINGFEAGVEGPISKKQGSSFLANYRFFTLELFDKLGIRFGTSGIPKYQDVSFKVNVPTEKAGRFSVFGLGGKSDIELLDSEQDTSDWTFADEGEDIIYGSDMGVVGVNHTYFFDKNTYGKAGLSLSASRFRIRLDTFSSNNDDRFKVYENNSVEGKYTAFYTLSRKFNAQHLVKGGVRYQRLFFDYKERVFQKKYGGYIDLLDQKDNTGMAQGFLHWQYRVTDQITLNSGLHYQHFTLNDSKALEPRVGAEWELHPRHELSFGYGMHSQTQPLVFYFMEFYHSQDDIYRQPNKQLDFTKSQHLIMGYDYSITKNLRLKSETYYQYLYDVPVKGDEETYFSLINVGMEFEGVPHVDSLVNQGTGENYGIEITLEKFFDEHYYFLLTGSLYESHYEGSDDVQRPTIFDGGYTLNALAGVEIPLGSENTVLGFNAKFTWAGGNRYVPIDLQASRKRGQTVYIGEEAYEEQYKPYSRLDLKADFRLNQKKVTQSWFVTVENVYNRKNILRKVYVPETGKIKTEYQLGLLPYGGYRITF